MSKTPQFDKIIEEILSGLKPHQRNCKQCNEVFDIVEEDIEFYKKFKVPAPTLCPNCRLQRRLGYRLNQLPIFYKKTCFAPNHNEKIISFYSDNNKVKVYDDNYYISDQWDALEFGKDFDLNKSFFEQFNQLALDAPHQALQRDLKSINCEYTISGSDSKNCYYVTIPYISEDIYYGNFPNASRNCIDVKDIDNSELCYSSVYATRCYNCAFCYESSDCIDSYFLFDCKNCQNCFGCSNLRNKSYCFFNEQLTKEEYQKRIKEINLGKRSVLKEYIKKFEPIFNNAIRKNLNNIKTENSLGNDLKECRNCFYAHRAIGGCENLRHTTNIVACNDSIDFFGGSKSQLVCDSTFIMAGSNNIKFSLNIWTGMNLEYSMEMFNCSSCFGCFGLKKKKFCVFNKQYSEEEYWRLVDKIKTEMLKNGEYGEFFPLPESPFPYIDSNAQIEFPLTKEEIIKNNWYYEEVKSDINVSQFKILEAKDTPDDIDDVQDDILEKVILCEETKKPFKITKFELDFYRRKNLPVPVIHPLERIKKLFNFKHPFKLWQYSCTKCGQMMYSAVDQKKNYKVYCEHCYQQEVV